MTKGTLLRNHRLLGMLALTVLLATLVAAHNSGGIHMNFGEMHLSLQSHEQGGLILSFARLS